MQHTAHTGQYWASHSTHRSILDLTQHTQVNIGPHTAHTGQYWASHSTHRSILGLSMSHTGQYWASQCHTQVYIGPLNVTQREQCNQQSSLEKCTYLDIFNVHNLNIFDIHIYINSTYISVSIFCYHDYNNKNFLRERIFGRERCVVRLTISRVKCLATSSHLDNRPAWS